MTPVDELVGRCAQIAALREQIRALLAREANLRRLPPIMITGETGTGKGLVAHIIHRSSSRSGARFVEVNGAAIPETLLESELFGYERGAFTDARQSKLGLIQVAHRGTLFLDEVALLPPMLQAKLLKVVEDASVRRLGSTRNEPVDACIISATNENPEALVRSRRFREDLYHRLAVITLALPPLRERGDDIELLAEQALARECENQPGPRKKLGPDALAALRAHRWPGNVRELNGAIARAVLMCPTTVISAAALELDPLPPARHEEHEEHAGRVDLTIAELERQQLSNALERAGWNISHAAAALGITRNTVRARIARFGLSPGRPGEGGALRPERHARDTVEPTTAPAHHGVASSGEGEPGSVSPVGARRGRPSIAVLPFHVEDEDLSKSYFGDGIVEDIVGALASLRELLVISRSSTLRYRGRVDVRVVGRAVGATYVLSGSVRRSGTRMRVSAELAETIDGAVMWASHFDGISDDLFALQDQIATRVVATIAPQVREAELRRALRKRPDNMEAYDCVLRGMAQRYDLNLEDFTEARTWLERAIALDPGYAAPYALLADWHSIRVNQGWSTDPRKDNAEVIRLATAAFERDSFDAMALALCGHVKSLMLHKFDDAIALFDRAISASPSSAIAWTRSSPTYSYIGDAREAIRRAEQGLQLSPLDLHVFFAHGILGLALYVAGEHEEGIRWGRKSREENPRWTANLRFLTVNLAAAGQLDEAREVGQAILAVEPGFGIDSFIKGYALRDPERRVRFADHLRQAGLPG
jgi:transcriptional regulator with AAA-type ATPase domain/TolB-like protein/tetratricopeptide (TPR) repeat protein